LSSQAAPFVILSDPLRQRQRGESEGSPSAEFPRGGSFALAALALAQRVAQDDTVWGRSFAST